MSKRKKNGEYGHLREVLAAKRDELNRRIEERRQEIVVDLEPEDEVGMALRNSSTGMAIANIGKSARWQRSSFRFAAWKPENMGSAGFAERRFRWRG
jgi:hypothetical protein